MNMFESVVNFFGITLSANDMVSFSCSTMELLGWATACISLTGAFLNARQKWYSFLVWMIANVSWIVYDLYNGCYAQAALFFAYLAMNIYGLYCWKFKTSEPDRLKEFVDEAVS